jgi:hypothetical protein
LAAVNIKDSFLSSAYFPMKSFIFWVIASRNPLFSLFASYCVSLLIMVHIFTVYAAIFLFTLHVSKLVGQHQMLSVRYFLVLNYNAIVVHLHLHIEVIISLFRFSCTPLGYHSKTSLTLPLSHYTLLKVAILSLSLSDIPKDVEVERERQIMIYIYKCKYTNIAL